MWRRLLLLFPVLFICSRLVAANYVFDYNTRCYQAYQAYFSLRIPEGDALIRQEFATNPYNLMATYLADYGDFLTLLFNGDPVALQQRQSHLGERQDLLDRADDREPWKRICKAGIYMHWALIRGRFGENFKAATTFRKSYLLIRENAAQFPDFAANQVFLGTEEAVAGTIPDEYKWLASIFGMKGNVRKGAGRLASFVQTHPSPAEPLRNEAVIFYQYIRFYLLSQQEAVWNFINSDQFPVKGNLLHAFVKTNIALNYHKAAVALQTMKAAQNLPGFKAFPSMNYELGNALFSQLDGSCIPYFETFVAQNKGSLYTKDALMKIAISYYLTGNNAKATMARQLIPQQGNTLTDADKQAQRFYEGSHWPNRPLTEARVLIEGGFYSQALNKLLTINQQAFSTSDQLEYMYRMARCYEETGDAARAVQYYQRAIQTGKDSKDQYAARAALMMGLFYEKRGQTREALQYFHTCLDLPHHDFQSSIDQQAKAGINRLSQP